MFCSEEFHRSFSDKNENFSFSRTLSIGSRKYIEQTGWPIRSFFRDPTDPFYGHEIEMYTVEQGGKRDKRQ